MKGATTQSGTEPSTLRAGPAQPNPIEVISGFNTGRRDKIMVEEGEREKQKREAEEEERLSHHAFVFDTAIPPP